jgi:hypothetical protein
VTKGAECNILFLKEAIDLFTLLNCFFERVEGDLENKK